MKVVAGSGKDTCSFEISSLRTGAILYRAGYEFSLRHTTIMAWGEQDTVWVYSGDVGTFVWVPDPVGGYLKRFYREVNYEIPPPINAAMHH